MATGTLGICNVREEVFWRGNTKIKGRSNMIYKVDFEIFLCVTVI